MGTFGSESHKIGLEAHEIGLEGHYKNDSRVADLILVHNIPHFTSILFC